MDSNFGNLSGGPTSGGPMSGPNTPSTPSSMEQRYSGTPGGTNSGGNQNISGSGTPQFPPIPSSPHTPTPGGATPISSTSSTSKGIFNTDNETVIYIYFLFQMIKILE
jgi:hypothetical protein